MAGLCAAARARELGASPTVLEKGTRPGGSMLLSSGMSGAAGASRSSARNARAATSGSSAWSSSGSTRALEWLESLGAPVVTRETGNPLTTGVRFDTEGITEALMRAAGPVHFEQPVTSLPGPLVLASGGFQGDSELVERYVRPAAPLRVRANPWSAGDGLRIASSAARP